MLPGIWSGGEHKGLFRLKFIDEHALVVAVTESVPDELMPLGKPWDYSIKLLASFVSWLYIINFHNRMRLFINDTNLIFWNLQRSQRWRYSFGMDYTVLWDKVAEWQVESIFESIMTCTNRTIHEEKGGVGMKYIKLGELVSPFCRMEDDRDYSTVCLLHTVQAMIV